MKKIAYSKDALKTLRRMLANTAALIVCKIELFATEPAALGNNLKPLSGRDGAFRLRVGDWRVVMTDDGVVIAIIKIGPRGSVYEE